MILTLDIEGDPKPKGSLRPFVAGGRAYVREQMGEQLKAWTENLTLRCRELGTRAGGPLPGPVAVAVVFRFTPPRARRFPWPAVKGRNGDVDKLARAVLDALTGTLIDDDGQVVLLTAAKIYDAERPGATIAIVNSPAGLDAERAVADIHSQVRQAIA